MARKNWEWDGYPKHLIVAESCKFRMATKVGDLVVSTVGEYYPPDREYPEDDPETIGAERYFETFVFPAKEAQCDCCDWAAATSAGEIKTRGYKTAQEARQGHMEVCREVDREKFGKWWWPW